MNESLKNIKETLLKTVEKVLLIGDRIKAKGLSVKDLISNSKNNDLDMEKIDSLGIEVVKLLKILKGNSILILNDLSTTCKEINIGKSENEIMLKGLVSKILECKSSTIFYENGTWGFAEEKTVGTMTDDTIEVGSAGTCAEASQSNSSEDLNECNKMLSLRRNETCSDAQTEDEHWNDTLQRTQVQQNAVEPEKTSEVEDEISSFTEEFILNDSNSISNTEVMPEKDVTSTTNESVEVKENQTNNNEDDYSNPYSVSTQVNTDDEECNSEVSDVQERTQQINEADSVTESQPKDGIDDKEISEGQSMDFLPLILSDMEKDNKDTADSIKETINKIIENVENESENLMDVTLEEFLDDDVTDLKPMENSPEIKKEICNTQIEDDIENLSDQILDLLNEIPMPDFLNKSKEEQDSDDSSKAEKIIKTLEESDSEFSSFGDSDSNCNSSATIIIESEDEEIKNKLKKYGMTECYVLLKHINVPKNQMPKLKRSLQDDIDWLCDLSNINPKKRIRTLNTFSKRRVKVKSKRLSTDSMDYSSSDSSLSDVESIKSNKELGVHLSKDTEEKLDDFLAKTLCDGLKSDDDDNDEDSDSDSDDSDSDDSKKNDSDKKKRKTALNESEKKKLTEEELKKMAWRNDPLLRNDFGASDCESKSKKPKYSSNDIVSLESSSSSDTEDESNKDKLKSKLTKSKSSFKRNSNTPSDSSDSDSDVQYVSSDPAQDNSPHKGRRDIRSILSDSDLAKETLRAKKIEMERIERLQDRNKILESQTQLLSSQQSEDDFVPLILDIDGKNETPTVVVDEIITRKLKPHQRDGVKFMWDACYESLDMIKNSEGSGCILAHCMGLGKTFQVLALCHTLLSYDETNTKRILIVCPLSTVNNWKKEWKFAFEGLPKEKQFPLFALKKKNLIEKVDEVAKWQSKNKSMLVMGYDSFENLTNDSKLDKLGPTWKEKMLKYLVNPGPDLIVCDEGHLIKNKKALRTQALQKVKTKRRIILTGTPLQNNLNEYYVMVNFVKPNLLGTQLEFGRNFANPIKNGQYVDSNEADIRLMKKMSHVLHKLLVKTVQRVEDSELELYLPLMIDYAVFIQLSHIQVELYNHYLKLPDAFENKNRKKFLEDFSVLQYVCTHACLLELASESKKKKIKEKDVINNEDEILPDMQKWWKNLMPLNSMNKIEYGTKLIVLKAIIEECESIGDKLLVFSQSLAEMDLIEHFLKTLGTEKCQSWIRNVHYFRMDGTVSPELRSHICDQFNDAGNKQIKLLLMSTKVGGLGLNLTAANRVVIMTVHWNPSYDTQSVFRVYRFGQEKQVFIYRLVALDTMESKVYQRQVTKLATALRVVDSQHIRRHYRSVDLQEMYSCRPNADEERPIPNIPEDKMLAKVMLKMPYIFKYHEHKSLLADRPEDKLSEQELAAAWDDFKNNRNAYAPPQPAPIPRPLNYEPNGDLLTHATFDMAYNLSNGKGLSNNTNYINTTPSTSNQRPGNSPYYPKKAIMNRNVNNVNNIQNPKCIENIYKLPTINVDDDDDDINSIYIL